MQSKRPFASDMTVVKRQVSNEVISMPVREQPDAPRDSGRRNFLRRGSTLAGSALAAGATGVSLAAPLTIPESNQGFGKPIAEDDYGIPSKFESGVRRRRTDILKNRQNFSDWSMTPLQHQHGIVTPNGLIYERHHNGTPDIDPSKHKLVIHGMVRQPLEFSMDDLLRYPSVSRFERSPI